MRINPRLIRNIELAALLACGLLLMPLAAAALESRCSTRIEVVLDSEVANPRNTGFITSLTGNPLYSLTWVEGKGSRHVFDLTGPGADAMCKDGVELLRRDAAILELRVVEMTVKDSN
jgi:hypothetical protein